MMATTEQNRIKLVRAFQCGDISAFEQLIREEGHRMSLYIRRFVRSDDCAEDVFQNTCARIWDKREQLRSPDSFKYWIYRIARNETMGYLRRNHWPAHVEMYSASDDYEPVNEEPDRAPSPERRAITREWNRILNEEMERLDVDTREILSLRFLGELELRSISETLNIPYGTVRHKLRNGLRTLRSRLERHQMAFHDLL